MPHNAGAVTDEMVAAAYLRLHCVNGGVGGIREALADVLALVRAAPNATVNPNVVAQIVDVMEDYIRTRGYTFHKTSADTLALTEAVVEVLGETTPNGVADEQMKALIDKALFRAGNLASELAGSGYSRNAHENLENVHSLCTQLALALAKVHEDTRRLDWLSQFVTLGGETRVTASDGLPAAMEWDWDAFDGGTLRDAIDGQLAMEAPRASA